MSGRLVIRVIYRIFATRKQAHSRRPPHRCLSSGTSCYSLSDSEETSFGSTKLAHFFDIAELWGNNKMLNNAKARPIDFYDRTRTLCSNGIGRCY